MKKLAFNDSDDFEKFTSDFVNDKTEHDLVKILWNAMYSLTTVAKTSPAFDDLRSGLADFLNNTNRTKSELEERGIDTAEVRDRINSVLNPVFEDIRGDIQNYRP